MHAQLSKLGEQVLLTDLSTNGVYALAQPVPITSPGPCVSRPLYLCSFVNGEALCRNVPRALAEDDTVSFGSPYVNVAERGKQPNPCQYKLHYSTDALPATQPSPAPEAARQMTTTSRRVVDLTEVRASAGSPAACSRCARCSQHPREHAG